MSIFTFGMVALFASLNYSVGALSALGSVTVIGSSFWIVGALGIIGTTGWLIHRARK